MTSIKYRNRINKNVIQNLYDMASEADAAAKRQGIKNKLSDRDCRRGRLLVKKARYEGKSIIFEDITDAINDTKDGDDKVGCSTVFYHKNDMNLTCNSEPTKWPAQVTGPNLSEWLKRRRGFCKIHESSPKYRMMMGDETFFGLERKHCLSKKEIYIEGEQHRRMYNKQGRNKRVSVWGAFSRDFVAPLVVEHHGQIFSSATYISALEPKALPFMSSIKNLQYFEDSASYHHSEQTTYEIETRWGINRKLIGPYWWDLSWMEKTWANMKDIVYKGGKVYADKKKMKVAVRAAWTQLTSDSEYRRRLFVAYESTCKKIRMSGGWYEHW